MNSGVCGQRVAQRCAAARGTKPRPSPWAGGALVAYPISPAVHKPLSGKTKAAKAAFVKEWCPISR